MRLLKLAGAPLVALPYGVLNGGYAFWRTFVEVFGAAVKGEWPTRLRITIHVYADPFLKDEDWP